MAASDTTVYPCLMLYFCHPQIYAEKYKFLHVQTMSKFYLLRIIWLSKYSTLENKFQCWNKQGEKSFSQKIFWRHSAFHVKKHRALKNKASNNAWLNMPEYNVPIGGAVELQEVTGKKNLLKLSNHSATSLFVQYLKLQKQLVIWL